MNFNLISEQSQICKEILDKINPDLTRLDNMIKEHRKKIDTTTGLRQNEARKLNEKACHLRKSLYQLEKVLAMNRAILYEPTYSSIGDRTMQYGDIDGWPGTYWLLKVGRIQLL